MVAADRNADQRDLRAVLVALGNLVRDARERALDGGGVKDDGGVRHKKSRTPFRRAGAGIRDVPVLGRFIYFLRHLAGWR